MSIRRIPFIRAFFGWLVLVTLAFHGLIPVGYMPGSAGAGSSKPLITICGSEGLKFAVDPVTGMKIPKPDRTSGHHAETPCAFSINSVFSFDGLPEPHLPLPVYGFVVFALLTAYTLRPVRRYGNASSRSPPLFS